MGVAPKKNLAATRHALITSAVERASRAYALARIMVYDRYPAGTSRVHFSSQERDIVNAHERAADDVRRLRAEGLQDWA